MSKVTVNKINTQFSEEYTEQDLNLVPAFDVISQFTPERDNVEFSIYNEQGLLEYIDYNYTNYTVTLDYNTQQNSVSTVNVNVEEDVIKEGYEQGNYTANYIFLRNQLSSSVDNPYYIKQISSDRTELRVANNNIENEELENIVNQFKAELSSSVYFEDFQLNLGNNNIFIANNILVDTSDPNQYTVLLKLYEPLEEQFGVKDTLWVTLQTADEVSYQVNFTPKVNVPPPPPQLKGPNFNIETKDTANNSTVYQDLDSLLTTVLTSSYNQIQGILAEKGITINVDYSDFNNFVYFSSAEKRVRNFFYKLEQIQEIDNEISTLDTTLLLTNTSSSIAILEQKKSKIIQNFDGYEKYQYYTSGSSTTEGIYPKLSIYPYRPLPTTNASATSWLRQETTSGSNYDLENPDRLVNSLPTFVVDNTDNTPFLNFMDMVGQHFDNVWTYTKDISNRFDADNRLNYGISKDLVADAIRSMGVNLYQNNFTDTNLYTAFTNLNPDGTGSYLNENTNELILDYITTQYNSKGQVEVNTTYQLGDVFYFLLGGNVVNSPLYFYVNQSTYTSPDNGGSSNDAAYLLLLLADNGNGIIPLSNFDGQPTIIDDVNKEIYKRIYHNLPYLLKKKGSIEGLRALINCYGIPDTILRISEFGGKDKTNSNDWDYFQNKFNYALNISGSSWGNFSSRWSINSAWPERMGLSPTTFTLRFKPDTLPSSNTDYKVLTNVSPSALGGWALALEYTGSGLLSSSYSGSIPSESKYDANLILWNTEDDEEIVRVTAPFYNKNWWTTAITVDPTTSATGTIVLYALESIYNGNDGFKLGVNTSASYSGDTSWWDGTTIHIPSQYSTGVTLDGTSYTPLTGSFQEVKYYGVPLNRSRVYDLAMNPYSIEGNNYSSSANDLAFRAPLGSDLLLTNLTQSVHPKITGSFGFITQSFTNGESLYEISESVKNNFVPNTEFIYYDQPAVGIKNRISEKIRSVDNITPSGDVLTPYRTIQQRYPQSESYTRDVNYLEVAFSPQNEINDDINSSFGYFNIGEYIGDPRQVSESNTSYQDLDRLRDDYFQKYYKSYDWKDYIRLIKYFDNSLFKMIKDFVPAKTSVSTGVVIKQHLLERNKHKPAQLELSQHNYSGSITSGFIEGGTGGVLTGLDNSTISEGGFKLTKTKLTSFPLNQWSNALNSPTGAPDVEDLFTFNNTDDSIIYTNPNRKTNRVTYRVKGISNISTGIDRSVDLQIYSLDKNAPLATIYNLNPADPSDFVSTTFTIHPSERIEIRVRALYNATNTTYTHEFLSDEEYIANPLTVDSVSGSVSYIQTTQDEFYNGEFNGNNIIVTDGNLNTVIVSETADNDSFIAAYNNVMVNGHSMPDDGSTSFTYGGNRGAYLVQFSFEREDSSGTNRSEYFDSLGPGDVITLKVNAQNPSLGGFLELTINSILNVAPAPGYNRYIIDIEPIYIYDPGVPLIFQSFNESSTGPTDALNFEIIYDQAFANFQTSLIGDEPLQNNVINNRQSIYFQDIDYSSGDGVLKPTNYTQILTNSATTAQIPDSNYTQARSINSRYKGSRASSPDFNVKRQIDITNQNNNKNCN